MLHLIAVERLTLADGRTIEARSRDMSMGGGLFDNHPPIQYNYGANVTCVGGKCLLMCPMGLGVVCVGF